MLIDAIKFGNKKNNLVIYFYNLDNVYNNSVLRKHWTTIYTVGMSKSIFTDSRTEYQTFTSYKFFVQNLAF